MLTQRRAARILADMKPLSQELRDWRLNTLRETPAVAARVCGMSAQHYWQLENAERGAGIRTATLLKLAKGTGIPLERLAQAAELQRTEDGHPARTLATVG